MGKKILIVDDDSDLVESTSAFLVSRGYTTVSASNGTEGLAMLEQEKPDLIVLDMMMDQRGDGFLFSRKMRKEPAFQKTPIIMLTGMRQATGFHFLTEDPRHPTFLPVDEFMEKPADLEELARRVARLIG